MVEKVDEAPAPVWWLDSALRTGDQGADQVDAVVQVVVLSVDVDPHQVGILVRVTKRKGSVAGVGKGRRGFDRVLLPLPVVAGAGDHLVEAGTDRPGGGELPDQRFLPRYGRERSASVAVRPELFERRKLAHGGDAAPAAGILLLRREVGQERQVVALGSPLQAELV